MAPEVVRLLLKRRPFVPFSILLPAETTLENPSLQIERPESAKFVGEETLEVFDVEDKKVTLIDLRLIVQIKTSSRL